jgi:hypothetical protein
MSGLYIRITAQAMNAAEAIIMSRNGKESKIWKSALGKLLNLARS